MKTKQRIFLQAKHRGWRHSPLIRSTIRTALSIFLSTFRFVPLRVPDLITIHTSPPTPPSIRRSLIALPKPRCPVYAHPSLSVRKSLSVSLSFIPSAVVVHAAFTLFHLSDVPSFLLAQFHPFTRPCSPTLPHPARCHAGTLIQTALHFLNLLQRNYSGNPTPMKQYHV